MNRLASILSTDQVLAHVDATSKKRAFEEAGLLFENLHGLSRALVTDSLFSRERLGSTGLGHGVAIPHGRIKGLKSPMAAVFQLARPISFDAPDEQAVDLLIFSAGARGGDPKAPWRFCPRSLKCSVTPILRKKLVTCDDAAQLHGLIAGWQSAHAV